MRRGALVAGLLVVATGFAHPPQGAATRLTGVVYDSIARHTIAGAAVEFVSANNPSARPSTTTSDASGRYSVTGVPLGPDLATLLLR